MKPSEYEKKRGIKNIINCEFDCEKCEKDEETCRKDLYLLFYSIIRKGLKQKKLKKKYIEEIRNKSDSLYS